jgi:hypothetical protein
MTRILPELTEDQLKRLPSAAEASVYRACRDLLKSKSIVLFSLPWIRVSPHGTPRDGETDFVLFDEARGILVIEVKGGGVRVDAATNDWVSVNRSGSHQIKDPFRQATREKYALRDYLRSSPKWASLRIEPTLGHAVLFPDLEDVSPLVGPDRPREIMGTKSCVTNLERWLGGVFNFWSAGTPVNLGGAGMKAVEELLCTPREVRPLLSHLLDEEEQEHIRLTEDQARVLRVLGRRNRVVVSGGAGTGKTLLALEKAREFASAGRKTLLVCYNRPLADHLKQCTPDLPHLTVASFHQLCHSFVQAANAKSGTDLLRDALSANPGLDEYQVHYPHALAMATEVLTERYDAIVVDEAQDFGEEYWFPIELLLRSQVESTLFIFCDHNQALYRRTSSFPITDEPFLLTRNCRNTRHIHEAAYAYYKGEPTEPPPLQGDAIQILDAPSRGSQAKKLHSHLVTLLDSEGVKPSSIVVLVPSRDHKGFYSLLQERPLPRPTRWAFEEHGIPNTVRVDTVMRFKGLEAQVVYLWGADEFEGDRDREILYVTLSRAKSRLFLAGDGPGCRAILPSNQAVPGRSGDPSPPV